ncbi:MAG: transporter substrate-binding domain-containing protein [Coriobacteriales bacterium]|nr:transporter substrate-binding domain-containing protein [Coriobacteriales bacterium]
MRGLVTVLLGAALCGMGGCAAPAGTGSMTIPQTPTVDVPTIGVSGVLRVGVDSTHAPFAGMSKGSIIGIDIDIAAALADHLGLKLEIVDMAGQTPETLLSSGSVDLIMAVDPSNNTFTTQPLLVGPYLLDGPALFTVSVSSTPTAVELSSLAGATVLAQQDSVSAWAVGERIGASSVKTVTSLAEAFDQLAAGTASYAASDALLGTFLALDYEDVVCTQIIDEPLGIYLGVSGSNQALADSLVGALQEVRDNGVLELLITKWLGPRSASVVFTTQAIVSTSAAAAGQAPTGSTPPASTGTPSSDTGDDLPDPSLAGGS